MFTKTCTRCNKNFSVLNIEDFKKFFHKAKVGKYGFTARCKKCRHETEIVPFREKRAEYDKSRRTIKIIEPIPCIVCNKIFTPKRDFVRCCSKECTNFKKKVYSKINQPKYREKAKKLRHKEIQINKPKNRRKPYSKEEIEYLLERLYSNPKTLAKKLGRTTLGVRKMIVKLKKETHNVK